MSAAGTGTRSAPARRATPASRETVPGLRVERELLKDGSLLVAGVDEVGRGALAGPVTVGVVVVDSGIGRPPRGLRDSKLLTPEERVALVPRIHRWALAWSVGHASAAEIDQIGILAALRMAGIRALHRLPVRPDMLLLDGNYDWVNRPRFPPTLFDLIPNGHAGQLVVASDAERAPAPEGPSDDEEQRRVRLMIKADLRCASVAAASVLAKVERDALMAALSGAHPWYAWHDNRGYATPAHLDALRAYGPCPLHRQSWRLPLLAADALDGGRSGAAPRQDEALFEMDAAPAGAGPALDGADPAAGAAAQREACSG